MKNEVEYICLEVSDNGLCISQESWKPSGKNCQETSMRTKRGSFALTNINNQAENSVRERLLHEPSIPMDGAGFSMSLIFPKRLPRPNWKRE